MARIRYIGDINPCRIKIANGFINDWRKGEIKEINDAFAHKLLIQHYFELVEGEAIKTPIKSDEVIVEERCATCGPRPKTVVEEPEMIGPADDFVPSEEPVSPKEEIEEEPEEEKVFNYKTALKDELLDKSVELDIETDYTMTVSELREKFKEYYDGKEEQNSVE